MTSLASPLSDPLQGLLYRQTDLAPLCAERPLDWTEYAHMNEFHGNASILQRYAQLPAGRPLPFAIEHAIPYDLETPYDYDRNCHLPGFLAVHEKSAAVYRTANFWKVEPIGFSYLYAMELFHRLHPGGWVPERRGTLVFPDKSTLLMDTDFDRLSFARRLAALPAAYQPVVICLYWKDYIRGNHRPFLEVGLPVVSAGHIRDPDFQLRLHDLCRRFRYACANDIAGSYTLSILSGCRFFYLPAGPLTLHEAGRTEHHDLDPSLLKPHKKAGREAAPFPPDSSDQQVRLAEYHAGKRHLKSPRQLRSFYHQARRRLSATLTPGLIVPEKSGDRARFFGLLPAGLDWDGWAHPTSQLRLPRGGKISALRLVVHLGHDTAYTPELRIYRNRRLLQPLRTPPFIHHIKLPGSSRWREIYFDFVATGQNRIPGEQRLRSFWIQSIELIYQPRWARWKKIFFKN